MNNENENTAGADDKQGLRKCLGTISDAIVGYATEKVDQINSIADKIISKEEKLENKIGHLPDKGEFFEIKDKIDDVSKKIDGVSEKISSNVTEVHKNIDSTRDTLVKKIDGINFDSKFGDVHSILSIIGKTVTEILQLQKNVEAKLSETESQLADKQREIENLERELQTARADLKKANDEIDFLRKDIGEKSGELTAVNAERDSVEKSLSDWREAAKIYVPVRNAMQKCPIFTDFIEQRGLTDDSEIGLFAFIQDLGKTIDFLNEVHVAATNAKKGQGNNPQPMTPEEAKVYDALNKCYRSIWEIDFDVFTTPGSRKSIAAPFEKTPFVKEEAAYLKDPRSRNWKFTKNIYVPLLLNREGKPYKQAQVDASSM